MWLKQRRCQSGVDQNYSPSSTGPLNNPVAQWLIWQDRLIPRFSSRNCRSRCRGHDTGSHLGSASGRAGRASHGLASNRPASSSLHHRNQRMHQQREPVSVLRTHQKRRSRPLDSRNYACSYWNLHNPMSNTTPRQVQGMTLQD